MEKKKFFSVRNICLMGVMSALVFALTGLGINLPSALGQTRVHFGNVMCLLASLLFGPGVGSIAAGVGSALYDLQVPAWAPEFWITFINKATMALVAGLVMHKTRLGKTQLRVWLAGLCGSLAYCTLYILKNIISGIFVMGLDPQVAFAEVLTVKLPVTLANGIIAVVCAGTLCLALRPALRKAKLLP